MNAEAIELAVTKAGLRPLTSDAVVKFEAYLALLLKWNARLNLTAVRSPDEILRRHFVECIQCAQALPDLPGGGELLDFGSGAGLPGIPIAICRPEIRVTLAESQGKKAAFLREVVRILELHSEVFTGRVQDISQERWFSAITLRAVDRMPKACRAAMPRLKAEGWLVLFTTETGKELLKGNLPEFESWEEIFLSGLERGLLLMGRNPG